MRHTFFGTVLDTTLREATVQEDSDGFVGEERLRDEAKERLRGRLGIYCI